MLIVAVEVIVDTGAIDELRNALRTMEEATRKESGCLTYAFSVDVNDPTMLRVFERWETMEALNAHFKTPHMAAFNTAIGKIQPKSIDIKVYEIAKEVPLPG
ncbi:MAG: antibiotic biosynthesis monooxygenase [Chloroflexales bacterium]|nr:antibiotic biosynthesis monooxygenase [Chloroflexales bacterium]